jgi:hypothetical protein
VHVNDHADDQDPVLSRGSNDVNVNERVYAYSPHPMSPSQAQMVVSMNSAWDKTDPIDSSCGSVYMQRSPTRVDQEQKCFAVVQISTPQWSPSPSLTGMDRYHGRRS